MRRPVTMWASSPATACPTRWRAGFHVTKSEHVDAPVIDELPLALDENGRLAVEKLHVITFDYANHGYYVLGEKVASAFEDGKKFK